MNDSSPTNHASEIPGRDDLRTEELRSFGHEAVDWMIEYLSDFDEGVILPEAPPVEIFARFQAPLPEEGRSPGSVLREFQRVIVPYATRLQHPGNFAYIANSSGIVGVVADLLAATLNQNVSLVRGGPSAAAVEELVVRWLRSLLGLPLEGGGVLTSGGSLANLMGLALARERAASRDGLVFYLSEETHSSIERALRFLGFRAEALRVIPTDDEFRLSVDQLSAAIDQDRSAGRTPAAVVASAGTIGSGAVDPLEEIADLCADHKVWLHVDGAYGACAAAAPSAAWMRAGLMRADSVALDPHKWLFVPIDTSCLLVRDVEGLRRLFTLVPEYLKVSAEERGGEIHQPMEHTVELSRRFRALRLWFTLKIYGASAVRERIEEHLVLARELASWIEASEDFELMAPVVTSTVCFRRAGPGVSDESLDRLNERIMDRINQSKGLFVSRNRLRGRFTLRVCITHLRTSRADVERLWDTVRAISKDLPLIVDGTDSAMV